MKGYVYLPEATKQYLTDRLEQLFKKVAFDLGCFFEYNSNPQVPHDADFVLFYGLPYHAWGNTGGNIPTLPKNVKVIQVLADIWNHGRQDYLQNAPKMYDRCDVLLTATDFAMKKFWPQFYDKCEFFPNYVSPNERWVNWKLNENPINKMCFTGHTMASFYPLRDYVLKNCNPENYFRPQHPGYHPANRDKANENPNIYIDDKYAKLLHSYLCHFNSCTINKFTTFKFLETTATGCLAISNSCDDMKKMGYLPSVHYVEVTQENALDMIDYVLNNPEKFTEMRKKAQEVTINNHTMEHRIRQIKKVIERVVNEN
jgi:hypothetical protein